MQVRPIDPRPAIGRYSVDMQEWVGDEGDRWRHGQVWTRSYLLPNATLEPSHDDYACPVGNQSKMAKKHRIPYLRTYITV